MFTLNERYITDAGGKRIGVILDLETFERLLAAVEDAEDIAWAQDYSARKVAGQLTPDETATVPFEQVAAELAAKWAAEEQKQDDQTAPYPPPAPRTG